MAEFQKICVVGLGYIGLPTAAVIASRGMKVVGVDINEKVVGTIASGAIHIDEPDLAGLVQKVVSDGQLTATTEIGPADVFMIAVPTPVDAEKRPDLTAVKAAARSIAKVLAPGNLVILESTCPVGTTELMAKEIVAQRPELSIGLGDGSRTGFSIAYCPERVLPGRILTELVNNARCVGGVTPNCTRRAQRFYKSFVRGVCIATTARAAEMVKLSENAFRDANIAFANELSLICDRHNVNVWEVIDLANRHPRVNILRPGPGVGGHCIAIDPWFLVDSAPDLARLIRTSREVNDSKIDITVNRAIDLIEDHPYSKVACCGITFKPNVDDMRESPAYAVAERLAQRFGERILIVEPNVKALPKALADLGARLVDLDDALPNCEVAVLLVDHDQFKLVPPSERRHLAILDTRGIWQEMSEPR